MDNQSLPDPPVEEKGEDPNLNKNNAGKVPGLDDENNSEVGGSVPTWAWWAGAVLVVLILFFGYRTIYGVGGIQQVPPLQATLGDVWERPRDRMQMLFVPPGTFAMGNKRGDSDEMPVHDLTLDGFWIDKTEVTNAQYTRCVDAGECATSQHAADAKYNGVDHPVVGVTWHDADTYCKWNGGQLPSNAQWEYAARGPDANPYPWGEEEPTCELAQYNACDGDTIPVGSYVEGASWVGAVDMAGNAWEWTNDWYAPDYYANSPANNPKGPENGTHKVLRGGGWRDFPLYIHGAHRAFELPGVTTVSFGFRCVSPGR